MAGLGDLLKIVRYGLEFLGLLIKRFQNTPAEKRRKEMIALDKAFTKAKQKNDLKDLSKWIGKKV